jgi:2-hydroxy-3-oxopropionate reductase
MAEKVGFIGLGIMGKPMARNLMDAGYELTVHNRSREPVDELAEDGATAASSPKEVAENSDVIVTMLPDSPQVEEVVAGEDGALEGVREGALLVDMSTISPLSPRSWPKRYRRKARACSTLQCPAETWELSKEPSLSW